MNPFGPLDRFADSVVVQRGLHVGYLLDSIMDCAGPALWVWRTW